MSAHSKAVGKKLSSLWAGGQYVSALTVVETELRPILHDDLKSNSGLSEQDAEDAVSKAIEGFLTRVNRQGPQGIVNPQAYIWAAARHQGIDISKARKREPTLESDLGPEGERRTEVDEFRGNEDKEMRAVYLVEGVVDDMEVTKEAAMALVAGTLERLQPTDRAIIEYILKCGLDQTSRTSSPELGISPGNFRIRKMRAYAKFRQIALQVRDQLQIEWRLRGEGDPYGEENVDDRNDRDAGSDEEDM